MEILQKLGFAGMIPMTNNQSNQPEGSSIAASASQTEVSTSVPSSKEVSFESSYYGGFPQSTTQESRFGGGEKPLSRPSSGFSPFSPDPNYLMNLVAEREANSSRENVLRGTKSVSQRFGDAPLVSRGSPPGLSVSAAGTNGGGMGARSVTPTGKDAFLGANRSSIVDGPARPSSGQSKTAKENESSAPDASGTRSSQTWEGPVESVRSPTTDSNGSVQFRMSMSSPTAGSP